MSKHFRTFNPVSPILADCDCWLFHGRDIDPLVAFSEREALSIAADLNSDKQQFGVVKFNAVEGHVSDVTPDFLADEDEEQDEYPEYSLSASAADRLIRERKEGVS